MERIPVTLRQKDIDLGEKAWKIAEGLPNGYCLVDAVGFMHVVVTPESESGEITVAEQPDNGEARFHKVTLKSGKTAFYYSKVISAYVTKLFVFTFNMNKDDEV